MTAVEFLEKELYERFHLSYLVLFNELIQQAKEMEKEQTMDFAMKFMMQDRPIVSFYNETFKSE
jgi:hypothetical protein